MYQYPFCKSPGKPPDTDTPFTVRRGDTVLDVAGQVHRDIAEDFFAAALPALAAKNVELRGDEKTRALSGLNGGLKAATEATTSHDTYYVSHTPPLASPPSADTRRARAAATRSVDRSRPWTRQPSNSANAAVKAPSPQPR